MNDFIRFFDDLKDRDGHYGWKLNIGYSKVTDWTIEILNYKGEQIIWVQEPDLDFAFAKAQVELKEWLLENEEGY